MKSTISFIIKSHLADDGAPLVGGSSKNPYRLVKYLSRRAKIARVIYFDGQHTGLEPYTAHRFRTPFLKLYFKTIYQNVVALPSVYRAFRDADIVQCHHPHFGMGAALLRKFVFRNKRLIVKAHGTAFPEVKANKYRGAKGAILALNAAAHRWHDRYVLKSADIVLCSSNFQRAEMTTIYRAAPDRVKTVYNGYDAEYLSRAAKNRDATGARHFVFCGRVVPKKGALYAIALFGKLSRDRTDDRLTLVLGLKTEIEDVSTYAKICAAVAGDHRISVVHGLTESELYSTFQRATVGFIPSVEYESIPTVLIEMMATGLPVFATNKWGVPELLPQHFGLSGELEEDCKMIGTFLGGAQIAAPCRLPSGMHIDDLSYDSLVEKYLEIYRAITGQKTENRKSQPPRN